VETEDEAKELVLTQDTNPHLDLGDLPFAAQDAAAAAAREAEGVPAR